MITNKHKRVAVYKVAHNPRYNNFLISQSHLFENSLLFTYDEDGEHVEKIIPMKYIGPHLKMRKIMHRDDRDRLEFRGMVYEIPKEVVFNYKSC